MKIILTALWLSVIMAGTSQASSLDSAEYHIKAADRYVSQHAYTKALNEYSAAINKDNKSFDAWLGKAKSELVLKNTDAAAKSIAILAKLARSKPQKFEYLLTEGQYYLTVKPKGWFSKLKQNFFKARKIDSSRPNLQLLIARAYHANGKDKAARLHYSKVIELGGREASIANEELASMFRQAQARGTGKGWVGDLAQKQTIDRATLAAILVEDIEIQNLFPQRSEHVNLPSDCKNNPFKAAIESVLNTQLSSIKRDANGLYHPDDAVTRFEMAKLIEEILIVYTKKNELSRAFIGTKSPFPDLNSHHYAYNAAFLAISRGLMMPDDLLEGTFAGNKTISGEDLLLMLRKLGSLNHNL